jgi:hypothetical protein
VYVRLHGDAELYVSGYTDAALSSWARRVRAWAQGRAPASPRLVAPPAPYPARRPRRVRVLRQRREGPRPVRRDGPAHRLKLGPRPAPPPDLAGVREAPRTRWPGFGRREIRRPCPHRLAGAPGRRGTD